MLLSSSDTALEDAALENSLAPTVFHARLRRETGWLAQQGVSPARAAMAAARAAALFINGERDRLRPADEHALPGWVAVMAAEVAPTAMALGRLFPAADIDDINMLRAVWGQLGTAEALMETGGDIRLQRDPVSALNGYGCSHRPRPWAITFASSTASSSSERGYAAADTARLRATAAILREGARGPVQAALQDIRQSLGAFYGLAAGSAVVLAASGTDTELAALALTHLAAPAAPILNILIAPEETGSGVPMAARGVHFAVDTALGHDVVRAAPIAGFRADTELANVPLRAADGTALGMADVQAEIEAAVAAGISTGRRVILHALDLSKTGLLAPGLDFLRRLRAVHGTARLDIVVDACQARLAAASVRKYLALDAVVLVTGSKFYTGPPFAGALLIPPGVAARLQNGRLPAGLDAYFGRDEFPAACPAANGLPAMGNYGLALRWHAAMAEMQALRAVSAERRTEILSAFGAVVATEIARNPALQLLPAPGLIREGGDDWECRRSIFAFSMASPIAAGCYLDPTEARSVYHWLNADISAVLPELTGAERALGAKICHIGQPVALPGFGGAFAGVLRVSAGARLISGEPSHRAMDPAARVLRELDDLRAVFGKIALILRHFQALRMADPKPRYR